MWPPSDAELVLEVAVLGDPKPAGSKVSGVATRWDPVLRKRVPVERDGRFVTFTKDDSGESGKSWRGDIRDAVAEVHSAAADLLDGPLALELTFYVERPKGHFGTGRNAEVLKPNAPRFPHSSKLPDGTKLARAFEDALNKVVWVDDRRICACLWQREYGRSRVEARLYRLPEHVGEAVEADQPSLLEAAA